MDYIYALEAPSVIVQQPVTTYTCPYSVSVVTLLFIDNTFALIF